LVLCVEQIGLMCRQVFDDVEMGFCGDIQEALRLVLV